MPINNLITSNDVGSSREIEFAYTFQKNAEAFLNIIGIAQAIKKENGAVLKTKKVVGTLESGDVGEGETIPVSKYQVQETVFDTIELEKYAKQISIEAIKEDPNVVDLTDKEFASDIQNKVQDKFYTMLKMGSLTGTGSTFQAAIAKAIGLVKDKFKKMRRTPTGIAVWVNTLDLYEYLGTATVNLATEFGFEYVKNFLGADIVFISSDIEQGKIIATPINNIKAYYIDPSNNDFASAGLVYGNLGSGGYVGFHSEPSYDNATTKIYAICGLRLFAEYIDGISQVTFASGTIPVPTLSVKSVAGTASGTTKLTVAPKKSSIGGLYYVEALSGSTTATTVTFGMDMTAQSTFSLWDGKSDITASSGKGVTVVETDADGKAVAVGIVASATVKS